MARDVLLLANARVVLADRVIAAGWVTAENGRIVEIGEGRAPDHAEDLAGDLLLPGLVELHTDHLEAHYVPRPKVHWDPVAAVVSYDGQLATCGITTVLDSLRVWRGGGAAGGAGPGRGLPPPPPPPPRPAALPPSALLPFRCSGALPPLL